MLIDVGMKAHGCTDGHKFTLLPNEEELLQDPERYMSCRKAELSSNSVYIFSECCWLVLICSLIGCWNAVIKMLQHLRRSM